MKKLILPLGAWLLFASVALTLYLSSGHIFYLFNFLYIGTMLALGLYLFALGYKHARRVTQLGVGIYMLIGLGFLGRENMQLAGFFYYLFLGVFQAAVIHYAVAKIGGPLIFGRGWCGYACWTAMILDLLPFKVPTSHKRNIKLQYLRYLVFFITFIFVLLLFILEFEEKEKIMYISFIIGNILYYLVGILMAYYFKDNRAFCKYFCPVTVFLKPFSYFSLLRINKTENLCIDCDKCVKVCPMDVKMTDNSRKREYGTECIICGECIRSCPKQALQLTVDKVKNNR